MKKLVFVGAGNVASSLALQLQNHAYQVVQIYSRTETSAKVLAEQVACEYTTQLADIVTDADLYIFAVKDSVLESLLAQIPHNKALWIHTAGSMPLQVFEQYTENYAVLYPLQTFTKGKSLTWNTIPIFVEANNTKSLTLVSDLANSLSENVRQLSSVDRKQVHLTGVFASNFTNHMYALCEQILAKVGLPFEVALPLIEETCAKIHTLSPIHAQTGPAVRYDENVMQAQLALIEDEKVKEIYRLISENIHKLNNELN